MSEENHEKECIKIAQDFITSEGEDPARYEFHYKEDGVEHLVNTVFDEDAKSNIPGGGCGKSMQLQIDLENASVKRVLKFQ